VSTGPPGDQPLPDDQDRLSTGQYDTFLVKVLVRRTSGHIVHGQVTHVATHQTLRFKDPTKILGFILTQIAQGPEPHTLPVSHEGH
jgi:hypothetical protein